MPDFGTFALEDLPATHPHIAPLYPGLPWSMPNARIVKLAYEVDLETVRNVLPAGLCRPVPPYGMLFVRDFPESPFGPFRVAAQTLASRYRTYGRAFVLQAVIDNPVALAAMREVWSYPAKPGTIDIADDPGSRSLRITVADPDGATLCDAEMTGIEGAEAGKLVIDAEVTVRIPPVFSNLPDGEPVRLLQINQGYALRDPYRGNFSINFKTSGPAYPWDLVPVTNTIIGIDTRADFELAPTDHVLDYVPDGFK